MISSGRSRYTGSSFSSNTPHTPHKGHAARMDHHTQDTPTQPAPFTPARSFHNPAAPTSTRKVSASFSTDCPLSGHPTIACSAVTASTAMKPPPLPLRHRQFGKRSSAISSTQSYGDMDPVGGGSPLKASRTYSSIPISATQTLVPSSRASAATAYTNVRGLRSRKAENIPPSTSMTNFSRQDLDTSQYSTPRLVPKPASPEKKIKSRLTWTRSRTFNAISNLKASVSRTSLGGLTRNESRSTTTSGKRSTREDHTLPISGSQSTSMTSSQVLPGPIIDTPSSGQVHTAQDSAYWTGRFMALQDRFQSETLEPENLSALVSAHAAKSEIVLKHFSSTELADMSWAEESPRPTLLLDEDDRCRRIFTHLDALCTTSEARISLQQWQQWYAACMGKKYLFPAQKKQRTRELTFLGRLMHLGSSSGTDSEPRGFEGGEDDEEEVRFF